MVKKVTPQDYLDWVAEHRPEITVLGTYTKAREKIEHQCTEGHVWEVSPNKVKGGSGCPYCSGHIPEDYSQWLARDGRGIQILEPYINAREKILHRCSEGHEWRVAPYSVKVGHSCPYCSGRIPELPYEEWLAQDGRGVKLLETYVNSHLPVQHRCAVGHTWSASPTSIKSGTGCPHCCGRIPDLSYEDWLIQDGRGIEALEPYVNNNTKIQHRCSEGHEWDARPANIKRGTDCPHCSGRIPQDYSQWLANDSRGIVALEQYAGAHTQIVHQCSEGHQWSMAPAVMKRGGVCPHCAVTTPQGYDEWLAKDGRGIKALEAYKGTATPIRHKCSVGHTWKARPGPIKKGVGCPKCAEHGFNPNKPAILYIAEHRLKHGRVRVNVGISNQAFERRYSKADLATVRRLYFIEGGGEVIEQLERHVHQKLSDCLDPRGLGLQKKIGSRECFKVDFDEAVKLAISAHANMGQSQGG